MDCTPGFCPNCGSILPQFRGIENIVCYGCKKHYKPDVFGKMENEYTIHFNRYEDVRPKKEEDGEDEGPVIERKCSKCSNERMSYATLQLRSADEGQTVFYTCTKCR